MEISHRRESQRCLSVLMIVVVLLTCTIGIFISPNNVQSAATPPDRTPPVVNITFSPVYPTTEDKVRFTATATDSNGINGIEILVNGAVVFRGRASPCIYTSSPFAAGTFTCSAIAYDTAGNKGTSQSLSFRVTLVKKQLDTIPPVVQAIYSPHNPTTRDNILFSAKAIDSSGISRMELLVNHNVVKTGYSSSITYTSDPFPEGTVFYRAIAYDNAGNQATTGEYAIAVTEVQSIDSARTRLAVPLVNMSYLPFYPNSLDKITFKALALSDRVKKLIMCVGSYRDQNGILIYPPVADSYTPICEYVGGPYSAGLINFAVYAYDENNHQIWEGNQEVRVLNWDNIPPQVNISYSPAQPTTQDVVLFTATAADPGGMGVRKIQISVNNQVVRTSGYGDTTCTWSGKLHEGRNTYSTTAWDQAFNKASAPEGEINVTKIQQEQVWIYGKMLYEDRYAANSDGNLHIKEFRPIRSVKIKLIADGHTYESTTDGSGNFSFIINGPDEFYFKLKAENPVVRVERDYDWCNVYVWWESIRYKMPEGHSSKNMGDMRIRDDTDYEFNCYYQKADTIFCGSNKHSYPGGSAYFNIAETIRREWEYATAHRDDNDSIGKVSVAYPDSNNIQTIFTDSTAWTNSLFGEIYLPCDPNVEKGKDFGFVDETILHEYAHHLTSEISENDWAIKPHNFCTSVGGLNADEFAWFEGFAEYLSHFLIKSSQNSGEKLSIERTKFYQMEEPDCTNLNTGVEGAVCAVLWDLEDAPSSAEPWDKIQNEHDTTFKIFDTEMDNYYDAPTIQEFVFCPKGWLTRWGNDPRGAAILPILEHYGMPTTVGMTWGGCGGN